jgi:hypothetical protein
MVLESLSCHLGSQRRTGSIHSRKGQASMSTRSHAALLRATISVREIIRAVNGKKTTTVKDLETVLRDSGRSWDIELDRNGRTIRGKVRL